MYIKLIAIPTIAVSIFLGGCGASNPVKTNEGATKLTVYSEDVSMFPGHPKHIKRYQEFETFPFRSKSGALENIQESAISDGAQALINIAAIKSRNDTAYIQDGVRWLPPTYENVISNIKLPIHIYYAAKAKGRRSYYPTLSAIYWVKKKNYQKAIPVAINTLKKNKTGDYLAPKFAKLIVSMGGKKHINDYIWFANNKRNESVAIIFIKGIAQHGGKSYAGELAALIKKRSRVISQTAARELAKFKLSKYKNEWVKYLKYHEDERIRIIAAEALISLGQRKVVESAADKDDSPEVRRALRQILLG